MKIALFETTLGKFKVELDEENMPITTENFIKLANKGFYNGTIFHRVISNFMIQGGDPTGTGMGGPGYKIKDEFSKNNHNKKGTISMANAGPNTGGSQFFISLVDNLYLDGKHPVFGKVVEGMDIVEKIGKTKTGSGDKPVQEIKINTCSIL
jgi:peptidylprolyl isomerase